MFKANTRFCIAITGEILIGQLCNTRDNSFRSNFTPGNIYSETLMKAANDITVNQQPISV